MNGYLRAAAVVLVLMAAWVVACLVLMVKVARDPESTGMGRGPR